MERVKTGATVVAGVVGGGLISMLGGWDSGLQVLVTVMAVDFITGLMVAIVFKNSTKTDSGCAQSKPCWRGLCKKCMTLSMVLVAYQIDLVAGTDFVRNAVIIGYIVNEILSITENAGQMGLPVPDAVKKGIDVLKDSEKK